MDVAYLSAASALAGSVVGGLTASLTTWITQRSQARSAYLSREMTRRDELYKDFIVAASRAYGDALVSSEPQIQDLISLYAMVSRMRVQSEAKTVASARARVEKSSTVLWCHLVPRVRSLAPAAVRVRLSC